MAGLRSLYSRAVIARLFYVLRLGTPPGWLSDVSGNPIPSNQPVEDHGGIGNVMPMAEWDGERGAFDLEAYTLAIANKRYQNALRISWEEREYNKVAQVDQRISDLGVDAQRHWVRLLVQLILNGRTGLAYDEQPFYSTTHQSRKSGVQSNLVTFSGVTTPTNPTATEFRDAMFAAIQQWMTLRDDAGEPANEDLSSLWVCVPPSFFQAAATALGVPFLQQGEANALVSLEGYNFRLLTMPRLGMGPNAFTDEFVLFKSGGRALVRQEVGGLKVGRKAEGSDEDFDTEDHYYGVRAVRGAGYGAWQSSVLVQLAA